MAADSLQDARIYLDHNATAPMLPEVREAMLPWLGERVGNASSVHFEGRRAREAVEAARADVAALLGAEPREVVLTPSATVANNLALRGLLARRPGRIVCTMVEHPSVRSTVQALEESGAAPVTWIGVDGEGRLDLDGLDEALAGGDVSFVTAMAANNETGALLPTARIADRCRAAGAPLHCDAVQAASTQDLPGLSADLLTVSAHKIGGPQGAGALLAPRRLRLRPFVTGGHQERTLVAGTENVAAIVGLGVAARLARERRLAFAERARGLRDRLEAGLPPGGVVNAGGTDRLPTTTNVSFDDTEGETLLVSLDLSGVACSSGSACTAGSLEPSHVLLAMGLSRERARAALRLSVGPATTEAEIDRVLALLPGIVADVRGLAPNREALA